MKKRIFLVLLLCSLILTACQSKEEEKDVSVDTQTEESTEESVEKENDIYSLNEQYIDDEEYDKVIIDNEEYCDELVARHQIPVFCDTIYYDQENYSEDELSEIVACYDEAEIKQDSWWNYDENGNPIDMGIGYKVTSYRLEDGTKLRLYDNNMNKSFIDENDNVFCLSSMSFDTEEGAANCYVLPYDFFKVIAKANEQW